MSLIRVLVVPVLLLQLHSCNRAETGNTKSMVIAEKYLLRVPKEMEFSEKKGVDSYVFTLKSNNGYNLHGEIGIYLPEALFEYLMVFPKTFRDSLEFRLGYPIDTTRIFFSDFPDNDKWDNTFSKNFYRYTVVNNNLLKIVEPKLKGIGVTGLIYWDKDNEQFFSLYGENLSEGQHLAALNIFYSLGTR